MENVFTIIWEALPYILGGTLNTVLLVAGAMGLGLVLGIPMAVGQVYGSRPVRKLVRLYVWFFRGVPILVQLFLFYFGLFSLTGINLSAFMAAIIVLGLTSTAYQSQIFRGAIQSLSAGQLKAARALGMSDFTAITTIILPQALRLAIPGWSNEYSILLKDSALAFVIGVTEIMARTHFVATRTFEHLGLYILAGAIYFVLTYLGVKVLRGLEHKWRIAGYTQ